MENKLNPAIKVVRLSVGDYTVLSINVNDIDLDVSHTSYKHAVGGYGIVRFWGIPLDEVINLRDKLTAVIDAEVVKINAKAQAEAAEVVAKVVGPTTPTVEVKAG